jgi:REP element-mobilizing transposase RayT
MFFEKDDIYHIYNMGNKAQPLFYNEGNYTFFQQKIKNEIKPYCEILVYCLMPNHFHFMVVASEKSVELDSFGKMQKLSRKFGTLQSSYSQAINNQKGTAGSLFRQKTKAKSLTLPKVNLTKTINDYALNSFLYIHQNPLNAGLVKRIEDWKFSSYHEYKGLINEGVCKTNLGFEILGIIDNNNFEDIHRNNVFFEE